MRIFKQAMLGEDVEGELRSIGAHRPPSNFGWHLPPFDAGAGEGGGNSVSVLNPKPPRRRRWRGLLGGGGLPGAPPTRGQGALGADDDATRRLERVGVKLARGELEGEATVLTKHRRGVEAKHLWVSAAFAFAVEVRPGGAYVTGVLAAVPHFSEDVEEEARLKSF